MAGVTIDSMCPFFIVASTERTIAYYSDKLGFSALHMKPDEAPFFAILSRDGATLFIKSGTVDPLPNRARDADMRWDAYLSVADPDALAAEFEGRGAHPSSPLRDTHDGLRGFEITDIDGHVLFFGHPR